MRTAATSTRAREARRRQGPESLARSIASITRPVFGRRGLAEGAIIAHWPEIAGAPIARRCVPEGIAFAPGDRQRGTLQLRVEGGALAAEIQHLSPILIERVNGYFGYPAVERLRLIQGPVPRPRRRPARTLRRLDAAEETALGAMLASVADPDLRRVLDSLGRALLARRDDAVRTEPAGMDRGNTR